MSKQCSVCKKSAFQRCSACEQVFYCSKNHQKEDWKNHKKTCVPFMEKFNEVLGRHVIASRDIKAGEVIMKKSALILGPKTVSAPLCLGCHKKLGPNWHKCSKCQWPLCNTECEKSPLHTECDVLSAAKYIPSVQNNTKQSLYSVITPLRALLLKTGAPKKFETLLKCQAHLKEHQSTQIYQILKLNLVPFFTQVLKLDTNETEIMTICSIFDTNCFDVRDLDGLVNIRGLYPTINLLAHDCTHNTKHSFHGPDFTLILAATVPIKQGDLITTTYTQTLWGTPQRRAHLKFSKLFDCVCLRCKDPTEFGTYAGSFRCNNCTSNIVSVNPLDPGTDWECESCGVSYDGKEIVWKNEFFKKEIALLDKSGPGALEEFLVKYRAEVHSKNSHFLQVKYALTQIYGNMDGYKLQELPIELVDRKIELCQELLDVAEVLEPGRSRFRGVLLLGLQEALVEKAKRELEKRQIGQEMFQEILTRARDKMEEATEILKTEPDFTGILQKKMNCWSVGTGKCVIESL